MSHPYFPQSRYSYRPGFPYQASVPASYGFGGYSAQSGRRVLGSLSPKYDWATPGYVRNEPSGTAGYGAEVTFMPIDTNLTYAPGTTFSTYATTGQTGNTSSGGALTCVAGKLNGLTDYLLKQTGMGKIPVLRDMLRTALADGVAKISTKLSDVVWNAIIKDGPDVFAQLVKNDVESFFKPCFDYPNPLSDGTSQYCLPLTSLYRWLYDYLKQQYDSCTTDTSPLTKEQREAADAQYCAQQTVQPGLNWYLPGRGCVSSDEYQMVLAVKAAAAQVMQDPPPGTPNGCARWLGQPGDWSAGVIDWKCNHLYVDAAGRTVKVLPAPGEIAPPYSGREVFVVDVETLQAIRDKMNAQLPLHMRTQRLDFALCRGQLLGPGQTCTGSVIPAAAKAPAGGGGAAIAAVAGIAAIAYFMMR